MDTATGVLIGLVASAVSGVAAFWWKSRRDLKTAAAQCYDRLIKLQEAQKLPDDQRTKVVEDEVRHVGAHMDLYLASLGAALLTRSRRRYWAVYERMVPVLITKDFSGLDDAIGDLRPLVKAVDQRSND
jgi:hypothetical protein